jgi:hypothetical protein
MSGNSIFDEAILDAKKLREVAEANARNALIEAVTPRVRELIERQLLGEGVESDESDEDLEREGEGEIILDLDMLQGGSEGPHDPGVSSKDDGDGDDLLLSKESVAALLALTDGQPVTSAEVFEERFIRVQKGLVFAQDLAESSASDEEGGKELLTRLLTKMLREAKTLRDEVIRIGGKDPAGSITPLNEEIQRVLKEIVDMASRKQLMKEGTEMFEIDLAELGLAEGGYTEGDYMEGDYMESSMTEDEEEEEGMDMEMPMDMDDDDDDADGDMVEVPDDLLSDPQVQQLLDLLSGGAEEGMDMEMPMDMDDDEEEEEKEMDDDEVVEIDEGMLRRELARMRANLAEADGAQDPDVLEDFGGAKVDKEVFVDGDDSDLNVHAEVRTLRKQVQNESRKNRALRRQLSGFKQVHAELKEQLEQMNLFNAKLLYVNKLMNKDSITTRQKKAVVEALDKAQTLREVRLLYKTLSESLDRRQRKGSINESAARRAGSASRVTRPGSSPQGASEQPDRWAVLAGISKDSK